MPRQLSRHCQTHHQILNKDFISVFFDDPSSGSRTLQLTISAGQCATSSTSLQTLRDSNTIFSPQTSVSASLLNTHESAAAQAMIWRLGSEDVDGYDLGYADSDVSLESHCSYISECRCEHCLETIAQQPSRSPIVEIRDGDVAKIRENVLAFMMEVRWRKRFPLLRLPVEVRSLVLRELLYQDDPIDFDLPGEKGYQNFNFHPQILSTCRQIYEEGSSILIHQNTFTIHLYGDEYHTDCLKWMDYAIRPSVNSRMGRSALFERISKLEISIYFEDNGGHTPTKGATLGHKSLVYELVEEVMSRAKRLSALTIECHFDLIYPGVLPSKPYRLKGVTPEDDEPSTIEQYILEPLANLRAATDELKFSRLPPGCEDFLNKRMDSIEQFRCDQQLRLEMMDICQDDSEEIEINVDKHSLKNTATA